MKRRVVLVVAGMLAVTAHAVRAQSVQLAFFGGAVVPSGDGASNMKVGYTFGLAGDVRVPATPFGVRIEGLRAKSESKAGTAGTSSIVSEYGVNANGVLRIPGLRLATPYLTGGASYSRLSFDTKQGTVITFGSTENEFGFNAGGGVDFAILEYALRADVRYKRVTAPGGHYATIPLTIGLRF